MNYGSYTTIDTPIKQQEKAFSFLIEKFEAIGATVRKIKNSHDFGAYPSFEIDYPFKFDNHIDPECMCGECEECKLAMELDNWHDKANEIEGQYNTKFEKYL